nr:protein LAZY 1-like [Tanacetum cinerariifolium]
MKPLDWMHRNPCTCLMGQPSLDDYEYYPKSNYYAKLPIKGRENQQRRSFVCLEVVTENDKYTQEQSSTELSELFHGFLAIGTLGTDQISSGAATPTFSTSGYLLSSTVGQPKTASGKKEQRTSLGELFQKTRLADENSRPKCNRIEKHKEKESDKSAVQLMRKILKWRKGSGGTIDNASADKKLSFI